MASVEREYTCAACDGTFISDWTEEDARAEAEENFGTHHQNMVEVCEDCYRNLMAKAGPHDG